MFRRPLRVRGGIRPPARQERHYLDEPLLQLEHCAQVYGRLLSGKRSRRRSPARSTPPRSSVCGCCFRPRRERSERELLRSRTIACTRKEQCARRSRRCSGPIGLRVAATDARLPRRRPASSVDLIRPRARLGCRRARKRLGVERDPLGPDNPAGNRLWSTSSAPVTSARGGGCAHPKYSQQAHVSGAGSRRRKRHTGAHVDLR